MTTQIELTYNPYKVKTELKVNGKKETNETIKNIVHNKRLQTWIDKLLINLFKLLNVRDIDLAFIGTALDSEDVKDAVMQFNKVNAPNHIKITCRATCKFKFNK